MIVSKYEICELSKLDPVRTLLAFECVAVLPPSVMVSLAPTGALYAMVRQYRVFTQPIDIFAYSSAKRATRDTSRVAPNHYNLINVNCKLATLSRRQEPMLPGRRYRSMSPAGRQSLEPLWAFLDSLHCTMWTVGE